MKKKLIAISEAVILSSALLFTGCAKEDELAQKDNTVAVETTEAKTGSLNTEGRYIGVIENTEQVEVVSKVSGTLTEVNGVVGQTVSAGSVLAQFDDTSARLEYEGAKAGAESAEKSLKSAQNSLESAQVSYQTTWDNGANKLGPEHELNDYNSEMEIRSLEQDIAAQAEKIEEYKNTTLDEAKHNVKKYKREKRDAATVQEEDQYDSKLDSAKSTLNNVEQNLHDMENKYNSMIADYEKAVGQREKNNGELYAAEQQSVANSIQKAQKDIDSASIGVESAQVGVESAANKVDTASYQLSLYTVTAPISGVIEKVNVEKNNYFAAGNVSFVISDPNSRSAVFHVPDTVAEELEIGQSVSVNANSKVYDGKITEVAVAVDDTGLFEVKAAVSDAADLADGVNIKVDTVIHRSEDKLVVPTDSVYFKDNQAFVYIVDKGHAVKKNVSVDIYGEENTTISDGLSKGSKVITTWSGSLNDGVEVKVTGSSGELAETAAGSGKTDA